jgi:hypothetical protein
VQPAVRQAERGFNSPFPTNRVVSYKQRKTKTGFQSLSPTGGEVWREGGVSKSFPEMSISVFKIVFGVAIDYVLL